MIHSFWRKKLASSRGAPQENVAKFRFAIHPQGNRQFHDNCKIAKCQTVATLAPVYGIDDKIWTWVSNFLKQHVVVDGIQSDLVTVDSGVPQGTVLGLDNSIFTTH